MSKDLETLRCFIEKAHYVGGLYLVYGASEAKFSHIQTVASAFLEGDSYRDRILLIWHRTALERAYIFRIQPER